MLRLTQDVRDQLVEHARQERPLEACGVLLGREGRIDEYYPMDNVDESEVHFTFDGEQQLKAQQHARSRDRDVLGVFHSHPSPASEAFPSVEDQRHGWEGYVYFILNFQPDEFVLRAFEFEGPVGETKRVTERSFEVICDG